MTAPPDKLRTAPAGSKGGTSRIDHVERLIGSEDKQSHLKRQPKAVARPYGVCKAVFVGNERKGFYNTMDAARAAAAAYNAEAREAVT